MVKELLVPMLERAFERARAKGELTAPEAPPVIIETPPNEAFGDYSCNMAMLLAKAERKPPMVIAERLRANLPAQDDMLEDVRVEKPGFINFYLRTEFLASRLADVLRDPEGFARSDLGRGRSVHLEFVSANPTGPLHVGHGRGAAVGDALARILEATGHRVHREYYVNDAGAQWLTAGGSTISRIKELKTGKPMEMPSDQYPGEYIKDIAEEILETSPFVQNILPNTNIAEIFLGDNEEEQIPVSATITCTYILEKLIKPALNEFRVRFDEWFSERSLFEEGQTEKPSGKVAEVIRALDKASKLYPRDGAKWLKTIPYGDEKDRVVVREDGRPTYLASDIAYHHLKFGRGFDRYINVWGADHHGYLPRVRAAVEMLGHDPEKLHVVFIQFVNLKRGDQPISMGKRSGEVVWLKDVLDEVGVDAARFFFLMRSADTTLEFDLELAKQQSSENPVYYVQYAHARTCSLLRQAAAEGWSAGDLTEAPPGGLRLPEEHKLALGVLEWPGVVRLAAERLEPHHLTFALIALAKRFHAYYNRHRILGQETPVTRARLCLARCVRAVVAHGLGLLGVSAPEQM